VLIYTSGTTGRPKGVMLSHDNMMYNVQVVLESLFNNIPDDMKHLVPDYDKCKVLSYLPLSHVAGMQFDLLSPVLLGSQLYFAKPDALQGTLLESLLWCRPTFFLAVPRIWEKFEDKLKEIAASKPAFLQSISGWAKGHGYKKVIDQSKGKYPGYMFNVANFMILKRIKQALGLDETVMFMFGAAPLK